MNIFHTRISIKTTKYQYVNNLYQPRYRCHNHCFRRCSLVCTTPQLCSLTWDVNHSTLAWRHYAFIFRQWISRNSFIRLRTWVNNHNRIKPLLNIRNYWQIITPCHFMWVYRLIIMSKYQCKSHSPSLYIYICIPDILLNHGNVFPYMLYIPHYE